MPLEQQKALIIVDAYSSGKYLAPGFKSHGYQCIHIQSSANVPSFYRDDHAEVDKHFKVNLIYDGDIGKLVQQLSGVTVKFIIPGSESGVILADALSELFNLTISNNTKYSQARRDKFLMHEALKANGIASMHHFKTDDLTELTTWIKEDFVSFPLVLKPLRSAGSDQVSFCYSHDDVATAFGNIIGSENLYSETNCEVLAQGFLTGQEYVVNTVGYAGNHYVTDIWRIHKKKGLESPIYDYEELISHEEDVFSVLERYVKSVLAALHINYGAGHCEVMMTADGPILIEAAARLAGSVDPSAITEALGYDQISMLVDTYLNPENFFRLVTLERLPMKNSVVNTFFICNQRGKMQRNFNAAPFSSLKGFHSLNFGPSKGDTLEETVDLINTPGYVYLVSPNAEDLTTGHQKIRSLEVTMYSDLMTSSR